MTAPGALLISGLWFAAYFESADALQNVRLFEQSVSIARCH